MEALDKLILAASGTDLLLTAVFALLIAYVIAAHFMLALANKRIKLESDRAEYYYNAYISGTSLASLMGDDDELEEADDEDIFRDDDDDGEDLFGGDADMGEGEDDFLDEAYERSEEEDRRLAAVLAAKRSQFTFDSDGTLVIKAGASVTISTQRVVFDDDDYDGDDDISRHAISLD